MTARVTWPEYYLNIADAVAVRADCTRRKVGAVVVKGNSIVSTGYNGAPAGEPGCLSDGACPRGQHYRSLFGGGPPSDGRIATFGDTCGCGKPWPCEDSVPPDSSYATGPGSCIALHAELNALLRAGSLSQNAVMYCTDKPCDACLRAVKGAGIASVVWFGGRWDHEVRNNKFLTWARGMLGV